MAAAQQSVGAVPLSTLCPKFLHTNSTSHTWPFSAIAELIDNAYDPDVNAKQIWIDKTQIKDKECLTFMDNGNGLSHEMMHRMLSFGYSDKKAVNDKHPIGMYGNGFKSGSMRLGQDAIVFSKSKNDLCVGMLSQSYLKETGAKQVTVPIISFEKISTNKFRVPLQHKASLQEILRYSPFTTEEELIIELRAIMSTCSEKATGTRIIIWNLRRTSAGKAEFDFTTDRYDIRIPCDVFDTISKPYTRPERITSSSPDSDSSLRAYCSILYLKPRMQIIIRGQKVKTQLISKSLAYIAKDSYKPAFVNKSIPIIFGYNTKSKEQYGIMMYYKNRLIKAYERVGCQLKANNNGVGVIGVVMCDFLEPTHNKQDFDNTDKYRKTIQSLGIKLEEYWKEIRFKRNKDNPNNNTPVEDTQKRPDQNWAQCHKCLKWRKLPDGIDCDRLPEEWFCYLNPDPVFRHCEKEEEQEDSDSEQHTNMKTYKKHEREDKKKQEEQRLKVWESKKRLEEEKVAKLARQNESLRLQQELLKERLNQMISSPAVGHSQSSPKTRRAGLQVKTPQRGASRDCNPPPTGSNLSQDACSPSTSSGLPIIVNTFSLPTTPSRVKRPQPKSPLSWSKRVRLSETISTVDPMSSVSPPTTAPVEDLDDDFIIIECSSTPIPKGHDVNLARVKMESGPVDARYGMASGGNVVQESSATGNCTAEVAAVGTHLPLLPPPGMVSTVTQTVAPRVKREEVDEQMNQSNGGMSISQAQEQQDRLIELMQTVSQERDSFQEQVDELNVKLMDMQTRLKQITDTVIKKESVDQTSQTEDGEDYKALYEQARQKVEELSREKEMMEANLLFPRPLHQNPENEMPVGELSTDQSNKEGHGLHLKVAQIKEEKANINLEGLRSGTERDSHTQTTATGPNVKNEADESSIASHEEATRSLVELRHNVGRLLLSYIPLELNQVNFNCNVIDEILEQVLNDQSCLVPINIAGYKTN